MLFRSMPAEYSPAGYFDVVDPDGQVRRYGVNVGMVGAGMGPGMGYGAPSGYYPGAGYGWQGGWPAPTILMGQMGPPRPFMGTQRIVVDNVGVQLPGDTPHGSRGSLGRDTTMGEVAPPAQGGIPASGPLPMSLRVEDLRAPPSDMPSATAALREAELPLGDPDARLQQIRERAAGKSGSGKSLEMPHSDSPSAPQIGRAHV